MFLAYSMPFNGPDLAVQTSSYLANRKKVNVYSASSLFGQ